MNNRAVTLIEIVISIVLLTLLALGIFATMALVSDMQGASGSSLRNQAAGFARETLEILKNAVSTEEGSLEHGEMLVDTTDTCAGKNFGEPCSLTGTRYTPYGIDGSTANSELGLPLGDLKAAGGEREYTVWRIADGNGGVAYKKVTVEVSWTE